jgi:hypothetical protein
VLESTIQFFERQYDPSMANKKSNKVSIFCLKMTLCSATPDVSAERLINKNSNNSIQFM